VFVGVDVGVNVAEDVALPVKVDVGVRVAVLVAVEVAVFVGVGDAQLATPTWKCSRDIYPIPWNVGFNQFVSPHIQDTPPPSGSGMVSSW